MNKKQVPVIIYNPPKCIRALSWSVSFGPLGAKQDHSSFRLKRDAMRFARSVFNRQPSVSAHGSEVPWDVTVSYSIHAAIA